MKVLITGGGGFIGSHVVRRLLETDHKVIVLAEVNDNLWRLQDVNNQIEILRGQLNNFIDLKDKILDLDIDGCIHLAWYVVPGQYLHSLDNIECVFYSLELLQYLAEAGCKKVVMAGSCFEYDFSKEDVFTEEDPFSFDNLYTASKLSCLMMAKVMAEKLGVVLSWGRIFYPYGPDENDNILVSSCISTLLNGEVFKTTLGEQIRDYIYVKDVAAAFLTLLEKGETGIYNIAMGRPTTIKDILNIIGELLDKKDLIQYGALDYRVNEPMKIFGKIDKIKQLGWFPQYSLEEGLKEIITGRGIC